LIRRLRKRGGDPFDIFNDAQDHVLRTAQNHVDRVILEAFVAGIERATDPAARALLDKVCSLYALCTIEADKAWFLEHGRLTPSRAKLLTSTVNSLLKKLRPQMGTLVEAFAIDDAWKAARILEEEPARQESMAGADNEIHPESREHAVSMT
jgi:acyl-CoA oxidase